MIPAARRTALRSQLRPNSNNRAPMPTWSTVMGIIPSAGPSTPTSAVSAASPAAAPRSAERHPRTIPTARTMVTASTHSTSDPRNAAVTAGPACIQSIIALPPLANGSLRLAHSHATRRARMQHIHSHHIDMLGMNSSRALRGGAGEPTFVDSRELELGTGTFGAVGERFGSAALPVRRSYFLQGAAPPRVYSSIV